MRPTRIGVHIFTFHYLNGCFVNLHYIVVVVFLSFLLFFRGSPEAADVHILPTEDPHIFEVRWSEPKDNGAPITSYTIYRRLVDENGKKNEWVKEKTLSNAVSRSFTVILDWGKRYEFVVTATNSLGEAKKEENKIKDIQVEKGRTFSCFEYFCKSGGAVFYSRR